MSQKEYEDELEEIRKQEQVYRSRMMWMMVILLFLGLLVYIMFSYQDGYYYQTYVVGIVRTESPKASSTLGIPKDSPVEILRSAKVLGGKRE
jgi:hypothetical protein